MGGWGVKGYYLGGFILFSVINNICEGRKGYERIFYPAFFFGGGFFGLCVSVCEGIYFLFS